MRTYRVTIDIEVPLDEDDNAETVAHFMAAQLTANEARQFGLVPLRVEVVRVAMEDETVLKLS